MMMVAIIENDIFNNMCYMYENCRILIQISL